MGAHVPAAGPTVDPEPFLRRVELLGPAPSRLDPAIRTVLRLAARLAGFSIRVQGREHVRAATAAARRDGGRGFVLAGVPHRAWVDPLLVVVAWPADAPRIVWLGDGPMMVRSRWRRALFPRIGMLPILPGAGPAELDANMRTARRAIGAGAVLGLFVEKGPPSPPDRPRTLAPGFAYAAAVAGVPVLPVVIGGSHRIVRGSPFVVRFLPAIPVPPPEPPGSSEASPGEPRTGAQAGRGDAEDRRAGGVGLERGARPTRTLRASAHRVFDAYRAAVTPEVAATAAWAIARAPRRARWRWLGTLFR
jgi:1-acyl-sn-glycerol-3-phosphate acyltransferase